MAGLADSCPVDHAHYMAPYDNIFSICVFGIHSYNQMRRPHFRDLARKIGVKDVADAFIQERREVRRESVNNLPIHEYVPLYFATHTPMQYVVTRRSRTLSQHNLVFIEVDFESLFAMRGVIVCNGNAASDRVCFYDGRDGLRHVKWDYVMRRDCTRWPDTVWKAAEVLVPREVPPRAITRLVVFDDDTRARLTSGLKTLSEHAELQSGRRLRKLTNRVAVDKTHYF